MISLVHPLETERLVLRPIDAVGDVDAIHAYASRADVCRYIPWTPKTRDEVAAWLPRRDATTIPGPGNAASLAVVRREDGVLVGDVMFIWLSEDSRCGEVGYVINPDHAGRGYATEAAGAVLAMGFEQLGMHRMVGRTDSRNAASAAVLRRLGMRQEAVLVENAWFKGEWTTEIDFAVLDHEWRARRG